MTHDSGLDRALAVLLAAVWLGLGIAGACLGVARRSWLLSVCGVFAIGYAWAWLRVAIRGRRLSWREFIAPWR